MRAGDGTTNDTPPRLRASARINLLRAWWLRSWTPAFAGERLGAGRMRASPRPRLLYDAGVTASSDAARALNARSALPLNCVTDAIEHERGLIGRLFLRTSKRSAERRVGNECVRPCSSRLSTYQ